MSSVRLRGMRTFYFAAFAALGLHAPYFPLWLEAHGFQGASMSMIAALSPALSSVGPPLVGALSDARGSRGNLLGWVCGLSCLAMTALALAEASGRSHAFAVVFGCVLIFSMCRAPILLLADRIALESGGNYGHRRLWGSIGFLLAASGFGRWCPPALSRFLPAVVALALGLAYLSSLRLPRASAAQAQPPLREVARLFRQPRVALLLCGSSVFAMSHASYDLCGSLAFRDLGAGGDTIGQLWAVGVLAEILVLAVASRLFQVLRPEPLLVLSYAVGALRWLSMSLLPRPELGFLLQPLHGISFGLVWISSLEVLRRNAQPSALGGAQGSLMAANSIGGTLGILVFGPLYAARGAASVFHLATLLACAAVLLAGVALLAAARAPARA
jgi:MFS transporter, PPP family, 3-phenylpropionic acid transporter